MMMVMMNAMSRMTAVDVEDVPATVCHLARMHVSDMGTLVGSDMDSYIDSYT